LQRPGPRQIPQLPQDRGQVVQIGGDGGVVRALGGLIDGAGDLLAPGRRSPVQDEEDEALLAAARRAAAEH
jgi:hypothetical protein